MDDARREFVSNDGIRWQYSIEHQVHDDNIAWRAHVWEADDYRGVLEGRVWTAEHGDPDTICSVALKMALDAHYLRDFAQDANDAPADFIIPAEDPVAADDTGTAADAGIAEDLGEAIPPDPAQDSDIADAMPGPDPLPSPA